MPTAKITAAFAATPPPVPEGKAKVDYFCTDCRGLLMEVRASGCQTFYVRYRDGRGKTHQMRVGRYGDITLDMARRKVKEVRARAAMGEDPAGERERAKTIPTFAVFADRYMEHAKQHKRSWKDDLSRLKTWILPVLGKKPLDTVTIRDVTRLHGKVREHLSAGSSNRVLALVKHMYALAVQWGEVDANPAKGIRMFKEAQRTRFLSADEVRRLLQAVDLEPNRSVANAIKFLLLTGARKSEALGARWSDIDLDRRVWTIPQERSKSRKVRHVPLSDAALRLLASLPVVADNPYLFPGKLVGQPVNNPYKNWHAICLRAGLADVRLHDVRHTFASFLAASGRSLYEIQTVLGHASPQMTMRYAHLTQGNLLTVVNTVGSVIEGVCEPAA